MGRIDDALVTLEGIGDPTERALQLAGLVSTLFKLKGVVLVLGDHLAFDAYAHTMSHRPEVELAVFAGELAPRDILEIMRGQLHGTGSLYRWTIGRIPVQFSHAAPIVNRHLCRDYKTQLGVVKLAPVEEIAADYILAAHHPSPDADSHTRAHALLVHGLADSFHMDWTVLHALCHRPSHRIGEELAQMRIVAKRDADTMGIVRDHVGDTGKLPKIDVDFKPAPATPLTESAAPVSLSSEPAVPEHVAGEESTRHSEISSEQEMRHGFNQA